MRYTTIPSTSVSSHALADLLIGEQFFEKELKRLWLLSALSSTSASSFAAKSNKTGVPSKFFFNEPYAECDQLGIKRRLNPQPMESVSFNSADCDAIGISTIWRVPKLVVHVLQH